MGGSTAARRINCPGSYSLEKDMPNTESEYAARGSMLHAAMEILLIADPQNIKEAQPLLDELEGQDLGFEGHEITAELIVDKIAPALQAWWAFDAKYGIEEIFIEQRVSLETEIDGAFGTADIIGRDKDGRLHVLDWKFGDGVPVPVRENLGAGFYAGGVLYDPDPELNDFREGMGLNADDRRAMESKEVVLHIVQPRAGYNHEDAWQEWETTVEWVEQVVDQAFEANEKALLDEPPFKPGPWCKFCSGQPKCQEYGKLATQALDAKAPDGMTAAELSDYLHKAELLKDWINKLFTYAQDQAEAGAAIPGYKLVAKRATRKWKDPDEVEKILKASRVKFDAMYEKKLRSPAQIEKSAKNVYSKKLADHVVSQSSGVTLVDDTDSRPAVTSGAELLANALPDLDAKQ
jgi:hypothetical protein